MPNLFACYRSSCVEGRQLERHNVVGLIKHGLQNLSAQPSTYESTWMDEIAGKLQLGKHITGDDILELINYAACCRQVR